MKYLKSGFISVLFTLCFNQGITQISPTTKDESRKPKLFADLPAEMPLKVSVLNSILDFEKGRSVNLQLGSNFNYRGVVVSKSDPAEASLKSIVIKSINRQGATLTFTRTINKEGDLVYLGRILSFRHSDAYELKLQEGQYVFIKKRSDELFNE